MNFLLSASFVLAFSIYFSNVQVSYGKGLGAAAMFLPPGCKELYDDIQKKVQASSPKLHTWVKEECKKQCNGKAPFSEADKYEAWIFTFIDKMNDWLKKQKPAMDIYTICSKAFNKQKMLMISGEIKRRCFETTPYGQAIKKNQDLCTVQDQKEFKQFSECVEKFIKEEVVPKIMANPPMDCIPKMKPYCANRKAVIGWLTFWMDTAFEKKAGKLGDPNLPDAWNPHRAMNNFYSNRCKAVTSDTKNGVKPQFPPWSDK